MKKATTGMAAAIHTQESAEQMNDGAKVQKFFDMCKAFEKIEPKIKRIPSIRIGRKALILLRERHRGMQYQTYGIEREYLGWISKVDFTPDVERAPSLTIEDAQKVTRCTDCGHVCASMMEEVHRESIALASIESITYII